MNSFFGIPIHPGTVGAMTLPLLLAVLLGGAIGLEREVKGHPAGLRTHILVCVGATLITLASQAISHYQGGNGDPGHIAAQIVSGIGFLGAGAILREGASIRGLTTAASVWTVAGIGIAVGASPEFGQVAVIATLIVLGTLLLLSRIERYVDQKAGRPFLLVLVVSETQTASAEALATVAAHDLRIESVEFEDGKDPRTRVITLRVCLPEQFDRTRFVADISATRGVQSVNFG